MNPAKLDLLKLHKADYVSPKKPVLLNLKPACHLSITGQGAPGGERFAACLEALYGMAFTIKMTRKFAGGQDYTIGKLECVWLTAGDPARLPKDAWRWKLLIRTPDFIRTTDLSAAVAKLREKGKVPTAREVALETLDEGRCVQMLHVGPYERECETFALMSEFAAKKDLRPSGSHHEIYISDPRRVPPENLKTILRLPVGPM
jgi:hypothetical protein